MNAEARLEAFEKMLTAVRENYNQTDNKMNQLKAEGKEKSATYRPLADSKMLYRNMLFLSSNRRFLPRFLPYILCKNIM